VSAPDTLFPHSVYGAILAAEAGDQGRVEREARLIRAYGDSVRAEGDTLTAISGEGMALGLEGYLRYRQGDAAGALPILLEAQQVATGWGPLNDFNEVLRLWIAEVLMELDRPAEALEWYGTFPVKERWLHPYAALRMGAAYEALGDADQAKDRYETALAYWRDAGPEMAERVAEARAGLARLGFAPRG
jgi:tetratricopeptide (TPR) repeat protein